MSRKKFPRCSGACHDGTQCGRRVTDGSQPPLCHLHNGSEHPSPIIPPSDEIDEIKILKRLARDPNPQVRLRAVDLLLELKAKAEKEQKPARSDSFDLQRLTDEERTRFIALTDQYKALKREVAERLDPAPPVVEAPAEPEPIEEPAPLASASLEEPEPTEESAPEPPWTPARYEAAGFIHHQTLGWIHPLGDEIGDRILSGEITFETAKQMTDAAQSQGRSLTVAAGPNRRREFHLEQEHQL